MALEKTVTVSAYGQELTFEKSYSRITYMAWNKDAATFTLTTFDADQVNVIEEKTYSFVPSVEDGALNFVKQAYEYLKTLPEFVGAVDV